MFICMLQAGELLMALLNIIIHIHSGLSFLYSVEEWSDEQVSLLLLEEYQLISVSVQKTWVVASERSGHKQIQQYYYR
jgi:hypothetical protein